MSSIVVIADHHPLTLESHAGLLRDGFNCEVFEVASGAQALNVIENQIQVDLVILDWDLPQMAGRQTLEKIRGLNNHKASVPVYFTCSEEFDPELASGMGAAGWLVKPLTHDRLKGLFSSASEGAGTVMVVDDSALIRAWTTEALESAGYTIVVSEDIWITGLIREHDPDLILMDIALGTPNSGVIAAESLQKRRGHDATMVFYSGMEESALKKIARDSNVAGYIAKTDDAGELIRQVDHFMSLSRRARNRQAVPSEPV